MQALAHIDIAMFRAAFASKSTRTPLTRWSRFLLCHHRADIDVRFSSRGNDACSQVVVRHHAHKRLRIAAYELAGTAEKSSYRRATVMA
jgi:hypothetical protein